MNLSDHATDEHAILASGLAEFAGFLRPELSKRERQVLLGWLRADSKLEAASSLYISVGTMNTHLTRIRTKYAAVGRPAGTKASLLARALQDGLTDLDEW